MNSCHSGQGRRYRAHARHKFRHHYAAQSVSCEDVLGSPNARVRLERNAAKEAQNAIAPISAQVKPKSVSDQAGDHRDHDPHSQAEFPQGG